MPTIIDGIDTSLLAEEEVLFFIRIRGKSHMLNKIYTKPVLQSLFPSFKTFKTISEYPNADHLIYIDNITPSSLSFSDYLIFNKYIKPQLDSIVFRCRGLRSIDFHQAKDLVLRVTKFWIEFFTKHGHLKLIIIHIVDNYVLEVMIILASVYSIKVCALSEFFIQHYRRNTFYGEYQYSRNTISNHEEENLRKYFNDRSRSFWLLGVSTRSQFLVFLYLLATYNIRLFYRYIFKYRIQKSLSYEYRFSKVFNHVRLSYIFAPFKFMKPLDDQCFSELNPNAVYIPLQVYPEANVDYWMNSPFDADYYTSLYEVLSFCRDNNFTVFLKEHPGFLFLRDPAFYKTVLGFKNVFIVHPFDKQLGLLDSIDKVIVWHGSTGVEALMSSKSVYSYEPNYYSQDLVRPYTEILHSQSVPSESDKSKLIRNLLHGLYYFPVSS